MKNNMNDYGTDSKSALQAKYDAQKIAFAPIMFQAALALRNLGILDYLLKSKRKGAEIKTIASNLNLSTYGVKVLLEAGLSLELVIIKDQKYYITKTGYFILSDELTKVNMNFTQDVNYMGMMSLEKSIVSGKPEGLKVFGEWSTVYEALSELPKQVRKSWFDFDHFYSDYAFPEVLPHIFESAPKKILDIGGNTGKFSIFCAENNADVHMTILDLPGQVLDAKKNIDKAGFSDRISTHALNLLDNSIPFPTGYNIIWMSQFLDCFSPKEITAILRQVKAAMGPDSRVFILELFPDRQRHEAGAHSLNATSLYFTCLANGNSRFYRSTDFIECIQEAGLTIAEQIDDIGWGHSLIECC